MYDVIVVGGGPAGMTAALYALRNGKSVLVLEKAGFGGQIMSSPHVENYPGYAGISGSALADAMMEQIMALGADVELDEAVSVRSENGLRVVETADGNRYEAKAVVLATGMKHRLLGLPEEEELLGGGDTALQDALFLANSCAKVTLIHRRDEFRGEAKLVEQVLARENIEVLYSHTVERYVQKNGEFAGAVLLDKKSGEEREIALSGLFLAVGHKPETAAFADAVGCDAEGFFAVGEDMKTKTEGVFVAGDCRAKTVRQLTTAVGDGACAALAACKFIDAM
ncbi:MAG: FAD-dependent oxidoreductase [Oscillospiraceae bacterium]|nr:FAD-dependent oxidoreductase [Oscillospiraceae bacterium]